MKRENTDIERLFEKLIKQPPLINEEKVHFLLDNATKSATSRQIPRHFFKTHLKLIIMSTIISSILVSIFFLTNFIQKQSLTTMPQSIVNNNVTQSKAIMPSTNGTVLIKRKNAEKEVSANANPDSINKGEQVPESASIPEWDHKAVSGDEYVMELTTKELRNLGVILGDSSIYYLNITAEGIISGYNRPYYWDDPNKRVKGQTVKRRKPKGVKMEKIVSFHSFYITFSTNEQIINNFNNISVSFYNELKQVYPKTKHIYSFYFRRDTTTAYGKSLFSTIDSLNVYTHRNFIYSNQFLPLKSMDDTLVPVHVTIKKFTDPIKRSRILWFTANEDLYKALPERYQEKIRNFYESRKLLKKRYPNANLVDYTKHYEFYDYMENLNFIELSKEELKKIGIKFVNDTDKFRQGLQYWSKNGSTLWCVSPYTMMSTSKKEPDKLNLYAPFHSGFKSKVLYKLSGAIDSSLQMKELIPVRVRQEQFKDVCPWLGEDMIFWYAPTEAFFDSLPPRIGNVLKQDYRTIMIRRDPNVPIAEKMKLTSSCTYFEECKATLFDVNFTIYPNPVSSDMTIDLQLQQPETLSISIFSVWGSKLLSLQPLMNMPAGEQRLTFSTSSLGAGIYLVTIQNKKGEFKAQRIIKL